MEEANASGLNLVGGCTDHGPGADLVDRVDRMILTSGHDQEHLTSTCTYLKVIIPTSIQEYLEFEVRN